MALVRPPRKANMVQALSPTLETSLEQVLEKLQEVNEKVDGARGQIRDMRTIMMGSGEPQVETEYGRVPMLEIGMREVKADVAKKASAAELKLVKADVDTLKSDRVTGTAHWSVARLIWAFFAGCAIAVIGGGFEALVTWALLKH